MTTHTRFDDSMTDGEVEDTFAGIALELGYTIDPESFAANAPHWNREASRTQIWVERCEHCDVRHIAFNVGWRHGEAETDLLEQFYKLVALAESLRSPE